MKKQYHIVRSNNSSSKIVKELPDPVIIKPSDFGLDDNLSGNNVRLTIIDTGLPTHDDIKNIYASEDLSDTKKDKSSIRDKNGHATMVSGIIGSNNPKTITGIAVNTDLMIAKASDSSGYCSYNAIIASVLWSIVKKSDIILIPLGSQTDYPILHDAIKKAYSEGICIIGASGPNETIDFPSNYPEVLSVGLKVKQKPDICIDNYTNYTTFLDNKYISSSGSSLSAALFAGLASLSIEKRRENKSQISPKLIYSDLKNLRLKTRRI